MTAPHVYIRNASLTFDNRALFSDLNLTLPAGKWVGLLGSSGIGKSSLLRLIAGLINKQGKIKGQIYTDNDIPLHRQIAFMAQSDLLLPWLTVLKNATLGIRLNPHPHRAVKIAKAKLLLEQAGLGNSLHLYPQQLSGGMRQRVALVRTLMEEKEIVLMDEPFSALDTITRYDLHELAVRMLHGKTVLFVTHDPTEALRLAHEIYIMQGQPASLESILQLSSDIPRSFNNSELIDYQTFLFHKLNEASYKNFLAFKQPSKNII